MCLIFIKKNSFWKNVKFCYPESFCVHCNTFVMVVIHTTIGINLIKFSRIDGAFVIMVFCFPIRFGAFWQLYNNNFITIVGSLCQLQENTLKKRIVLSESSYYVLFSRTLPISHYRSQISTKIIDFTKKNI